MRYRALILGAALAGLIGLASPIITEAGGYYHGGPRVYFELPLPPLPHVHFGGHYDRDDYDYNGPRGYYRDRYYGDRSYRSDYRPRWRNRHGGGHRHHRGCDH